jgi:hypothetical protein
MSEYVKDGILFVTRPLNDPYRGSSQYDPAREREETRAFWEAKLTGADLSEEQRQAIREKTAQFREATAWFKENRTMIPPGVVGIFQTEAKGLLEYLGYEVTLDPGPMPS